MTATQSIIKVTEQSVCFGHGGVTERRVARVLEPTSAGHGMHTQQSSFDETKRLLTTIPTLSYIMKLLYANSDRALKRAASESGHEDSVA